MPPIVDQKKCIGCSACVSVCPAEPKVFELKDTKEGSKSHVVHPEACIECGACVATCPTNAIKLAEKKP
jgi:NAD-dependent dihydropyrimidine dehydrogenase PreA subunit